ncbi:hypothetical protein DPMN_125600 [Dreissena polymorpha]|uniref:Uncharacterized protein n=1 Tax=Dreissena polymorpha TaxID=45954 RepID=A0A9D4GVK9_DREPO|nr:hypothetical protein DPMN_125600 [Dreissena polymorpha]
MLPITSGHLQYTTRQTKRCQDHMGTCRRLPDGFRQSPKPLGHIQETPRQSDTVQIPSGHLQEIPKQSSTSERLSDTVTDCLGVSCRCPSGLRVCLVTSHSV